MEEEKEEQETKFCSNCKRDIPSANFIMHEHHCRRHVQLCEVCGEPVPKSQMEEHTQENHVEIPCEMCRRKVAKDRMEEHMANECPERSVHCDFCNLDIKLNDYKAHIYVCGSRTDICEECQMRVMLRDMEKHRTYQCGQEPVPVLASPNPSRPPVLDLPLRPPRYAAVELDSAHGTDDMQWPGVPTRNTHSAENPHYVTVDDDGDVIPEQEMNPSAPSEVAGHLYDSRPANPTIMIDPAWLSSMKAAYGEDADLDALLAQNVMMENMRQVTAKDDRSFPDDLTMQPRRPGINTQRLKSDAELAHCLQHEFNQQDIFSAHDTSIAQQLQNNIDADDTHTYQHTQPVPPENTADDEALAMRLQEEENRRMQELSARQYDLLQEEDEERSRVGIETEEASGIGDTATDEDLARRLLLEDKPSFAPVRPRDEPRIINLTANNELHYGGYNGGNQFGVRQYHNYAASGSHGVQLDGYKGEGQGTEPPTCESRQEAVEQIDDIPCDLCSEAVPFNLYNEHLQEIHGINGDGGDFGRYLHHHHRHHNHVPVHYVYPPSDPYYRQEHEYGLGGQQSPRQYSTHALEESNVVRCRFCEQSVSRNNISNHEAVCLQNQHSGLSSLGPEPALFPTHSTGDDSAMAGSETMKTMIPCEFCKKLYPLLVIAEHQKQCHQHPARSHHLWREDHGQLSPHSSFSDCPLLPQADYHVPVTEAAVVQMEVPCEKCDKMFPFQELHRHQAVCMLSHPLRDQSGTSSGPRHHKLQSHSIGNPPAHSPVMVPLRKDLTLSTSSLESEQVLRGNQFPLVSSPVDQELLMGRDASITPLAPIDMHKAAKSRWKANLAPSFSNAGSHHLPSRSDPSHEGVLASSPLSPSQDESSPVGTKGEGRGSLVTGYDISSGSEISSDQNSSELVVMASQIDDCHITSGTSSCSHLDRTSSESSYSDLSPPDRTTAFFARKRQRTKLITTVPANSSNNHQLVNVPHTASQGVSSARPLGSDAKSFGSGVSMSGGKTTVDPTKNFLYRPETKYTAAGKTSSRQYGALRNSDSQPVQSSICSSSASFQVKGSAVSVANRRTPGIPNGASGAGKVLHSHVSNPNRHSGSSMYTGNGTRKPSTYDNHSGSGARNPAQKVGGTRQSHSSRNSISKNSSRAGSYPSGGRTNQNGF